MQRMNMNIWKSRKEILFGGTHKSWMWKIGLQIWKYFAANLIYVHSITTWNRDADLDRKLWSLHLLSMKYCLELKKSLFLQSIHSAIELTKTLNLKLNLKLKLFKTCYGVELNLKFKFNLKLKFFMIGNRVNLNLKFKLNLKL